jgi:hypothetical protein
MGDSGHEQPAAGPSRPPFLKPQPGAPPSSPFMDTLPASGQPANAKSSDFAVSADLLGSMTSPFSSAQLPVSSQLDALVPKIDLTPTVHPQSLRAQKEIPTTPRSTHWQPATPRALADLESSSAGRVLLVPGTSDDRQKGSPHSSWLSESDSSSCESLELQLTAAHCVPASSAATVPHTPKLEKAPKPLSIPSPASVPSPITPEQLTTVIASASASPTITTPPANATPLSPVVLQPPRQLLFRRPRPHIKPSPVSLPSLMLPSLTLPGSATSSPPGTPRLAAISPHSSPCTESTGHKRSGYPFDAAGASSTSADNMSRPGSGAEMNSSSQLMHVMSLPAARSKGGPDAQDAHLPCSSGASSQPVSYLSPSLVPSSFPPMGCQAGDPIPSPPPWMTSTAPQLNAEHLAVPHGQSPPRSPQSLRGSVTSHYMTCASDLDSAHSVSRTSDNNSFMRGPVTRLNRRSQQSSRGDSRNLLSPGSSFMTHRSSRQDQAPSMSRAWSNPVYHEEALESGGDVPGRPQTSLGRKEDSDFWNGMQS